jgi:hypothetical protein
MKNENWYAVGGTITVVGVAVFYLARFAPEITLPEHLVKAADVGVMALIAIGTVMVAKAIVKKVRG